ncbi:hypothetical protein M0812_08464 [Anaeramoeba flamelloides]|uniref:Uncharacterized protein n=1 Tax=Anaeramoeba flamelloides TaxID=1746091 RepID=A0AAV8A1D9_9EUKA|nr:hypothetical protein M0812_08464 [Anaeramoeba flamelloides]
MSIPIENENEIEIPQPKSLKGYEPLDFETLQNKNLNNASLDYSVATDPNTELFLFRVPKSFDILSLDQKVINLESHETQLQTKEQNQDKNNFLIGGEHKQEKEQEKEKENEKNEEENHFKIVNTTQLSKEELEQIVLMLPDLERKEFKIVNGIQRQFEIKREIKLPPPPIKGSKTEDLNKKKKSKKKKKKGKLSKQSSVFENNKNQKERKRISAERKKKNEQRSKKEKRKKKKSRKNSNK